MSQTTPDHYFWITYLQNKCDNRGFTMETREGFFILKATTSRWKHYNDQAYWRFNTAEECCAFLDGFMTRGAYMDEEARCTKGTSRARKPRKK